MCIICYLYLKWMEGVEFRYFLWNPSWLLQRNDYTKTMNIITIYLLEIKIRKEDWTRKIGRPEAYLYAGWLMPGSRWAMSWPENSGSERPLIAGFFFLSFVRHAVPRGQRADLIAALDRGDGRALDRVFDCNEPELKRLNWRRERRWPYFFPFVLKISNQNEHLKYQLKIPTSVPARLSSQLKYLGLPRSANSSAFLPVA